MRNDHREPVASYRHTVGLLALICVSLAVPYVLQRYTAGATPAGDAHGIRPNLIPGFLASLAFDWGIFFYAWMGVKQKRGTLSAIGAGRWRNAGEVLRDIGIAIPFWAFWELVAYAASMLILQSSVKAPEAWVPPKGTLEVGLWFAVSSSAGFCEEVIFRGYLLKQFAAFTGSLWLGVLLQAVAFGAIHPFRGWRYMAVVSIVGLLYGGLAAWRRDLKPGILAHAMSDIWEGWLKHVAGFKI